jgi:uncharacterized protein YdhG (YjbR/CyaY superfamily)
MPRPKPETVDAYIASQPEPGRAVLERVRRILRKALPGAEEVVSYGIGAFKLHGRIVLYFAGFKEHFSIYPANDRLVAAIPDLAPHKVSKGTLRFPLAERVPEKLITAAAKFRAAEVAAAHAARPAAPKKKTSRKAAH